MKRSFHTTQNANISNVKPNATLEGIVVALTNIFEKIIPTKKENIGQH